MADDELYTMLNQALDAVHEASRKLARCIVRNAEIAGERECRGQGNSSGRVGASGIQGNLPPRRPVRSGDTITVDNTIEEFPPATFGMADIFKSLWRIERLVEQFVDGPLTILQRLDVMGRQVAELRKAQETHMKDWHARPGGMYEIITKDLEEDQREEKIQAGIKAKADLDKSMRGRM